MSWHENLIEEDNDIREILRASKRIAVVGIKDEGHNGEAAYSVPNYMRENGYEIIPVNPNYEHVFGTNCRKSLDEVQEHVDAVLVFRAPKYVPDHAKEVLEMTDKPGVFWMQSGIANMKAAHELANAGIKVVQDHCIYREHLRLIAAH
ncbi:MAG: CoA-binding protein [Deferribacteres bacterium]|nr:CoA-binding protein [candidate division KSB1 bacterium]MCB9511992.1 CoA-binding protein [Deferribacteres bacterium]